LGASAGILLYQYIRDYRLGVNRALDRHRVLEDGDGDGIEMENV